MTNDKVDTGMTDLSDQHEDVTEPPQLRFLRRLVTVLTAVMIGGVILIIALIVIRFNRPPTLLPEKLVLPDGERARAVTQGDEWIAIVTQSDRILIFDRVTGKLRQTVMIEASGN